MVASAWIGSVRCLFVSLATASAWDFPSLVCARLIDPVSGWAARMPNRIA